MKYLSKTLTSLEAFSILKNETEVEDAMYLLFNLHFDYNQGKFDNDKKYEKLFDSYKIFITSLGHMCGPYDLYFKVKQEFLPYAKDVLHNNYQGSIEDHPLYLNIKAAYDAAIKHYVENPEYYEREDYMGG